ncbi:hypothetical protein [Nocardioides sp. KR10-350]|uniref:hypothetical protein n=1 Tax=Nocardioides cheoyonin TaxID=3156615 RepID=UPI0032B57233
MRMPRLAAPLGRPVGRAALPSALAVLALLSAGVPGAARAATSSTTAATPPATTEIKVVQGNMRSPQSVQHFQADVRTVMAQKPDFITYNEVAYRDDAVLAPGSYDLFRTPGKYTGETAVAWNGATWTALDEGTFMVSDKRGKTARQKVELGRRYASWATLQNAAGTVVSVVSVHTAPDEKPVKGLLRPSVTRLGKLVAELAKSGPLIVGGDFNVQYDSKAYKAAGFDAAGLTPTYDITGRAPATGDHRGATIDYLFLHRASQFAVQSQYVREINSDHDLLVGAFGLATGQAPTFVPGTIANDPRRDPGAAVRQVIAVLDKAPEGASVHLVSRHLYGPAVRRAIESAHARGVHVQLITGDRRQTALEKRYAVMLGGNVHKKSFAVNRPQAWKTARLPNAGVLASVSGGTPAVRVDLNRALIPKNQRLPTTAHVWTTKAPYDDLFVRFFKAVGRTV